MVKLAKLDLDRIASERYPDKKIPKYLLWFLKKIMHQNDLNKLFALSKGRRNLDFVDDCMKYFNFNCKVFGRENLPPDTGKKFIFVSNHPQGGIEAICIAYVLGHAYGGKIKFYANEFLTILDPLKDMFLPINKHRRQNRENIRIIEDFYHKSEDHLIIFPAGVTSFKHRGKVLDHQWQKNFIQASVCNHRDVIPLFFQAKNSNLFYRMENFRKFIHSKVNFEIALFVDEIFRQKGNSFTLYIGRPIPWEKFDKTLSVRQWADYVRNITYHLPMTTNESIL